MTEFGSLIRPRGAPGRVVPVPGHARGLGVIARPLDRLGMLPCTILYVLSIPVIASLGLPGHGATSWSRYWSRWRGFVSSGCISRRSPASAASIPTAVRAFGVGWFSVVRPCRRALSGPSWSGVLVGQHMSMSTLFYWATLPLALGTVASIVVTVLYQANYHKRQQTPAKFAVGQTT